MFSGLTPIWDSGSFEAARDQNHVTQVQGKHLICHVVTPALEYILEIWEGITIEVGIVGNIVGSKSWENHWW